MSNIIDKPEVITRRSVTIFIYKNKSSKYYKFLNRNRKLPNSEIIKIKEILDGAQKFNAKR